MAMSSLMEQYQSVLPSNADVALHGAYAIFGQSRSAVPLNVEQSSPWLAKLISGCPPTPLMTVKKARGITWLYILLTLVEV